MPNERTIRDLEVELEIERFWKERWKERAERWRATAEAHRCRLLELVGKIEATAYDGWESEDGA